MAYKLLLADDSITVQRVIELTFSREDVEITAVGDGEEAIARITAEPPDIVLADVGMQRGSGYDVAAFIKGRRDLRRIPVLLLTGAFEPLDMQRAAKAGYDGVLVKPFEPHQVIARVHEAMRDAAERAASTPDEPEPEAAPPMAPPAPPPATTLTTSPAPAPAAESSVTSRDASPTALDAYFERLDAALDTYTPTPPSPVSREDAAPPQVPEPVLPPSPPQVIATPPPPVHREPAPEPYPPPPSAKTAAEMASILAAAFDTAPPLRTKVNAPAAVPPKATPAPAPPAAPGPHAVADAFSALLAVEEGEEDVAPPALGVSLWTPILTSAFVDEVTRRVVERLAPDIANGIVARAVADAAERVVREQVARVQDRSRLTTDRA